MSVMVSVTFQFKPEAAEMALEGLKQALPDSSVGTEPYIFHGPGIRAEQRRTTATPAGVANQEEEREDEGQGDEARGDASARGFHTCR
mgnify:CR=1 FL=1